MKIESVNNNNNMKKLYKWMNEKVSKIFVFEGIIGMKRMEIDGI